LSTYFIYTCGNFRLFSIWWLLSSLSLSVSLTPGIPLPHISGCHQLSPVVLKYVLLDYLQLCKGIFASCFWYQQPPSRYRHREPLSNADGTFGCSKAMHVVGPLNALWGPHLLSAFPGNGKGDCLSPTLGFVFHVDTKSGVTLN
jgi:hypothetical protein